MILIVSVNRIVDNTAHSESDPEQHLLPLKQKEILNIMVQNTNHLTLIIQLQSYYFVANAF